MRWEWILILILVLLLIRGLPFALCTHTYEIVSEKVKEPVVIVVLSDLHDSRYGKGMKRLLDAVHQVKPDLVLMPGDMSEIGHKQKNMMDLMRGLRAYPCFFSTGNHEEHDDDPAHILDLVRSCGVVVLEDRCEVLDVKGTRLQIGGLRAREEEEEYRVEEVTSLFHGDGVRILLSHRPHWVGLYEGSGVDLVVCGHAHGGQWRIPFLDQGLLAPGQGLFPKYTQGLYSVGSTTIAVSRGLVRTSRGVVRLYNDPEVMVLELRPSNAVLD